MAVMDTLGILVLFQSDNGSIEQLALGIGLGAVEAGANIRLRRLCSDDPPEINHRGYGKLAASDLDWADCVVLGIESEDSDSHAFDHLFQLLSEAPPGQTRSRTVWLFSPQRSPSATSAFIYQIERALQSAGFEIITCDLDQEDSVDDQVDAMKQTGRTLVSKLAGE